MLDLTWAANQPLQGQTATHPRQVRYPVANSGDHGYLGHGSAHWQPRRRPDLSAAGYSGCTGLIAAYGRGCRIQIMYGGRAGMSTAASLGHPEHGRGHPGRAATVVERRPACPA